MLNPSHEAQQAAIDERITFRRSESVGDGIVRLSTTWIDAAVDGLCDRDDHGVHAARKALKRVRAILRLVRDPIGYHTYRQENVVLRDVARVVAPVRDGKVLVLTLDALDDQYGSVLTEGIWSGLRSMLSDRHRFESARILADEDLMAHLVTTLRVARARFASWPGSGGDDRRALPDSFDTMAGGVERVYRRGRRAMARAIADPQEAKVHEWRKRVKYLRHQTEAIQGAWPAVLGPLAGALDDLGELLGLEHDLAVLDEAVRSDPGLLPEPSRRKVLHAVIEIERDLLQQQAFAIGRRVYVEPPGRFLERVGAYWGTWRSEG